MARTRLQTRAIDEQRYDYGTLKIKGEVSPTSTESFGSDITRRSRGRFSKKLRRRRLKYEKPDAISKEALREPKQSFWPSVAIGTDFGPMSEYQRVSKQIEDWKKIIQEHEVNHPAAVPQMKVYLKALRKERARLEQHESAHQVEDQEAKAKIVQDRIGILQAALKKSKPPAERDNIQGAIAAYESGEIGYSRKYTLIWAGKVVDTCETYPEFTIDRMERLDQYAKEYGPHWLWYEPPLVISPSTGARMMRCGPSLRQPHVSGCGPYHIKIGFQKRAGLVTRSEELIPFRRHVTNEEIANLTEPDGRVWCYNEGPRLVFNTLLDSGASFPTLYQGDLEMLGVHPDEYPAQCIEQLNTSAGLVTSRSYDLRVEVIDQNSESLVDPNDPIHPTFPPHCGAVVGVIMYLDGAVYDQQMGPDGLAAGVSARLSGQLPFDATYVSSTPGNNVILFGEDRNDVLGFAKMPPARRWVFGAPQYVRGDDHWEFFVNPLVTFSHRNGEFVDQDVRKGVTTATAHPGTLWSHQEMNDPGNRLKRQDASQTSPRSIFANATWGPQGLQSP